MTGIDISIQKAKTALTNRLWTSNEYYPYGRAFPNVRGEKIVPEVLISGSDKYQDVLADTRFDAVSFFLPENDYEIDENYSTVVVGWYFAVNLRKLYPSVSERATEYAHRDVLNIIKMTEFEATGLITGFDAFEQFGLTSNDKDNMSPFYLFRVDTKLQFEYNDC